MQERIRRFFTENWNRFKALERPRRVKLLAACGLLLAALGVAAFLVLTPSWVPLMTNLDFVMVNQIQGALDAAGIPNRDANNGTSVEIHQQDLGRAQLAIAASSVAIDDVFTYADALDASGMGATESVRRENFIRARESELAQSLLMIDGIERAVVNLSIPRTSPIPLPTDERASAGVLLTLSQPLDGRQATALARYVAMSVQGLRQENITIADTAGNLLFFEGSENVGFASNEFELERMRRAEFEAQVRFLLAPIFDDVRVLSNIVVNLDHVQTRSQEFTSPIPDSATGLVAHEDHNRMATTTSGPDAEPGVLPNAAMTYQMGAGGPTEATVNHRIFSYLHNQVESFTERPSGGVMLEQSSAIVNAIRYNYIFEIDLINDGSLEGTTWEAFQQTVLEESFDVDPAIVESLAVGTGLANIQVLGHTIPIFVDHVPAPGVDVAQVVALGILALLILLLALAVIRRSQADEVTEVEPELSVEDLLVSTQMEEQREAEAAQGMQAIEFAEDSELKKLLGDFIDDKPDAVAQLLRNWLGEEWG